MRTPVLLTFLTFLVAGCPTGGVRMDAGRDAPAVATDTPSMGTDAPVVLPEGCGEARQPCCRGSLCGVGLTCTSGTCAAPAGCGTDGEPCCSASSCAAGLVCDAGTCAPVAACGGASQPCCGADACSAGLVCARGTCAPTTACGGARQPCCDGTACASGLSCSGGTCETIPACGDTRQPCCGTACNAGLTCMAGTCDAPDAPPDTCGPVTECGACTGMSACGFCRSTGTCAEGSALGPSTGSCADWAWYSGACTDPDPCASAGSCDSCTAQADCGYCRTTGDCASGSSSGPDVGSCADWAWVSSACEGPADPCTTDASTCDDCTRLASCGFCASSDTCLTGTATGPLSGSCADWQWNASECVDPCAVNLDCDSCAAASGCGYCASTDACVTGSSSGPSTGFCSDWRYSPSECTPPDPCAVHGDCDACASASGCGWCEGAGGCVSGDSTGPATGTCSDWRYSPSECTPPDPCASSFTCGDCAARSGCGWCGDDFSCLTGSSSGPSAGSCVDWVWSTAGC